MTIIFHLEKFVTYGQNKNILAVSGIYLIVVAVIGGSVALLKFKTVEISKAFNVKYRENRIRLMKSENLTKSQRTINKMNESNLIGRQKTVKNLDKKFKRRGMRKKTNLNMVMRMAIKRDRDDSIDSIESIDNGVTEEGDSERPVIMCVTCDARESDCMLQPCRHAVYCQFCALDIMNDPVENWCKLCYKPIEELFVLEKSIKNGEIFILAKLKPKPKSQTTPDNNKLFKIHEEQPQVEPSINSSIHKIMEENQKKQNDQNDDAKRNKKSISQT